MKTLKSTRIVTTALFMLFMFIEQASAQLEFIGNYADGMGAAGWNANGSGPEPYGYGHGDIFYYTASRDYVDGEDYCGAKLTDVFNGFPAFEDSLTEYGFSYDQVTFKTALADLGDDIEGIDYFTIEGLHYCNFYPVVITIELDGEPLVEGIGNYSMYITGANVREFQSGFLKINNISGSSSGPVQNVAAAFLEDMANEELQLFIQLSENNIAPVTGNGRNGAYVNFAGTLTKGLPTLPFQGLYAENRGFAGWDADGTGPEPFGDGHLTQVYYVASVDYDGINPDPDACLGNFIDGADGFLNTLLQLQYNGYAPEDLKLKMGLTSLGPDVQGPDWGYQGSNPWCNYYNNVITFELDGEPVVQLLADTNRLTASSYLISNSSTGKGYDISENQSGAAGFVAKSLLKDLGSHALNFHTYTINIVQGSEFTSNGRNGAVWEITDAALVASHQPVTFVPPGDVSGTWTAENSPYYVDGHLEIADEDTLTIEPGVKVAVRGPYHFDVQGCVKAEGNAGSTIIFTRSNPNLMWDGFDFDGTPVSNDPSVFDHCIFEHGKAQGTFPYNSGGAFGIRDFDGVNISRSMFRNNRAIENSDPSGGAIALWNASPVIQYCTFYNNTANYGGAVMCYAGSDAEIIRNLFYNNTAENDGGAIQIWENSNPDIINNTFSLNNAANSGGAIDVYSNSDPFFVNNIFWGNEAVNAGKQISVSSGDCDITVKYCDVEGGESGIGPYGIQSGIYENNIDEDPVFIDMLAWDFNLDLYNSPCINAGDPSMPDPDGTAPEMGCYYYPQTGVFNNSLRELKIYPNPATSKIIIVNDSPGDADVCIEVFNFLGQKVNEQKMIAPLDNEMILDISNFQTGTYLCKWMSGEVVRTAKFVKK